MAYFGKEFKTVSQENFDGFVNALGANIPEDIKKALAAHKPTFKVSKNGDQYTFTSGNFNGTHEVSFTPGVEYSETVYGSPVPRLTGGLASAVLDLAPSSPTADDTTIT